jgi:hypothetical protein
MRRFVWLVPALVLVVATGLWLWWRAARPGTPSARSLQPSPELEPLDRQLFVVQRFAPVFLQNRKPKRTRTDNGEAYEDHFVRIDYDGDWNGFDNSANLKEAATHNRDLTAHVYYGVQETARHYYLHFAYFHPRDPKWLGFHENDVEGGMVVVRKVASWSEQLTRQQLVMVQAQAHNRFAYRKANELCDDTRRPHPGAVRLWDGPRQDAPDPGLAGGRGCPELWARHRDPRSRRNLRRDAFVYVPGEAAGVPVVPPAGTVHELVSLTGDRDGDGQLDTNAGVVSSPGLWDRRFDTRLFGRAAKYARLPDAGPLGHALQSGDQCKANLPWGWFGVESNVPHGMFFLDPARFEARATLADHGVVEPEGGGVYVSNVYLKGTRIPGTRPVTSAPVFDCDCEHMMAAFGSSTAGGMDARARPLHPGRAELAPHGRPGAALRELGELRGARGVGGRGGAGRRGAGRWTRL